MLFMSIWCSKCGATNDGTIIGLNPCHRRNLPENHSFPNVLARGEDLAATVTAQVETIIKKFFLTQVANRAGTEDSVILSPAGYCQRLEEKIHYEKVIQQSVPTGKQIVPTKDLENIQLKAENENQFVSLITPFLNKVISNISKDLILVNCKDYKWIRQNDIPGKTSSDLTPDLFVTRTGIQIAKEEPSNQLVNEYRKKNLSKKDYRDLNFGMMPWRGKCYVRVIMEFMNKNLMDRGDFEEKRGKVFQYLSSLIGDDMDTYYTGILGGRDGFTSVTWHGIDRPLFGPITSWNLLGSEEIFRGLIQKDSKNVWLLLLENALQHFKVQLREHSSFLGAGRFGHVFHVLKGRTKSSHALKIVKYDELEISGATAIQMDMEFRMLKDLQDRDDVVKLAKDSALHVIYEGTEKIVYAYLMATVGTPILPHTLTEPLIKEIFASLLIFHQAGYYHGDCRLQNLLLKDKKVVFCDFRPSMHSESDDREQFGRDFQTLIESILRNDRIYGNLSHLLAAYVKEPSLDEQNDIIKSLGDETCLVWKKYDVIELRPSVKITTTDIHKVIDQTLFLREWHRVTGEGEGSQNKRKTAGGYDMLEIYNATGGLLPVERGGQGDCFFPALAAQLNLPESPFRDQGWDAVRLRETADDALDKFYLKYLTTDEQTFLEAQAYLSKPNRKGWWADNFLIVPLVTSLQINLRIWYSTTLTSHDFGIGGSFTANLWYDPDIHYRSLEPGNKPVLEAERESSKKATGDEDSKSTQVKKKSKK